MNRDAIISFIYSDPECRLQRFCKSVTKSQPNGDWEELQSIVLERLCSLPHSQVEDLWKSKDGFSTKAIWIWLHTTARVQAHGNRTAYQRIVLNPKCVRVEDEFFDKPIEVQDFGPRIEYEKKLANANEKFNKKLSKFTRIERVVLETYIAGGMNAAQVCKAAGVPYAYYMAKLSDIKRVVRGCFGINEEYPKTLLGVSTRYKNIEDVPNWKSVKATFISREKRRYRQQTLFPIRAYLPPVFRKIKIA